ncbi:MAG: tRNA guanosine(34) transglycosylase Tgt [Nitrospira sp.]|nr:tRNA guanosine(34) transglycosylase Tgt [Nitrospira sp.]
MADGFFTIEATDSAARAGVVRTAHGSFLTPTFMAVGTQGAVKACTPDQVRDCGIEVMLANTYHLMLRPGADTVAGLGGLHRMSGWAGPMLTDSGGYQVFSLSASNRVTEDGVTFKSHLDGSEQVLTPERSMEVQHLLGADIVMQLDDVPELPTSEQREAETMRRSLRWLQRCREALPEKSAQGHRQRLFGIVQGGLSKALREESAASVAELGLAGNAIGGLSVGETKRQMADILGLVTPLLPIDRPRYLMGVGFPEDILDAVMLGVDMFDCVIPTRSARHAMAFTSRGRLRLRNAAFSRDTGPIDDACDCYACTGFSRGYVRHLLISGEFLGMTLLSIHNLHFYGEWMKSIRAAVEKGRLADFAAEHRAKVSGGAA